jgi:phytoene dehydrogenase-like protein
VSGGPGRRRLVVVGAGHNGLVCACYLAQAGHEVVVLEQAALPGGGSRTDELLPGFRFDTHSVAHNIINMTGIPDELELEAAGLRYVEMDPFAVAVHADGRRVRFHRSIEATIASIAEHGDEEARAYRALMAEAVPLVRLVASTLPGRGGGGRAPRAVRQLADAARLARRGPLTVARSLLAPYGRMLEERLPSDLCRAPMAAFAAHAGASPDVPGGAFFGFWQAAYHLYGQWHATGGSQALTDALVRRLEQLGGEVRCSSPVERIEAVGGTVRSVLLEDGQRLTADAVVAAIDPKTALLELLDPPLEPGGVRRRLQAAGRSNAVQALVHVATDRLPPYEGARQGDWNGLQSFVDTLDDLRAGFRAAEDGRLRRPAPAYAFTTSALDTGLALPGGHTVYLAAPAAPFEVEGGWEALRDELAEDLLEQVERRAPGFRASVKGVAVRTPEDMARELRWPGAHPMILDISPDQLGPLRPTLDLADHRTPVGGLYLSGAGTAPAGGISGVPGRRAARALLRDQPDG